MIEFAHRQSTSVASLLMAALAIWTFRARRKGHRARKAAVWTIFLLFVEALLGAALVLRHWVESNASLGRTIAQAVHFTNTLLLMAALTLTAWFLGGEAKEITPARGSRGMAWMAVAATIVVGATGSLAALADTLFPSPTLSRAFAADLAAGSPLLVRMRWVHPAAAVLGFVAVVGLLRARKGWDRVTIAVASLLALQFLLGGADVLLLAPTWMQVLHLLGADLYWIALVVLAAESLWPDAESAQAR